MQAQGISDLHIIYYAFRIFAFHLQAKQLTTGKVGSTQLSVCVSVQTAVTRAARNSEQILLTSLYDDEKERGKKHIKSFMKQREDWKTGKITVYRWSAFTFHVLPSLFTPLPRPLAADTCHH